MEAVKKTILESYLEQKATAETLMKSSAPSVQQVLDYHELVYRIAVFETIRVFLKAAPKSVKQNVLAPHYKLFEEFLMCLINERKLGVPASEEKKKEQDTALNSLNLIFNNNREKFKSYAPKSEEEYSLDIFNFYGTMITAWIQYRNMLINIETTKEEAT